MQVRAVSSAPRPAARNLFRGEQGHEARAQRAACLYSAGTDSCVSCRSFSRDKSYVKGSGDVFVARLLTRTRVAAGSAAFGQRRCRACIATRLSHDAEPRGKAPAANRPAPLRGLQCSERRSDADRQRRSQPPRIRHGAVQQPRRFVFRRLRHAQRPAIRPSAPRDAFPAAEGGVRPLGAVRNAALPRSPAG